MALRGLLSLAPLLGAAIAGPCDIYAAAGAPCAAAHSLTRALFAKYAGPLYQLQRSGDNATLDVHALAPGGAADGAQHEKFCAAPHPPPPAPTPYPPSWPGRGSYPARAACVVLTIYDQSGNGNHLLPATPAINNPAFDNPVNATRHPISLGGHRVYGGYFETGMGYRAQNTSKVAVGNEPETVYMVSSGTHVNAGCCFDYGNSENDCTDHKSYCDGCMEAVYVGNGYGGGGKGTWIGADMENGIYGGKYGEGNNTGLETEFLTAMIKGGTDGFAVKGGDAAAGPLQLMFDGPRPHGYQPMHKTGAIILGVGGDNLARRRNQDASRAGGPAAGIPGMSIGTFYEGVLTAGRTSDLADAAVQADILRAGYGK